MKRQDSRGRRGLFKISAAVVVAGLALAGCSSSDSGSEASASSTASASPVSGGTLTVGRVAAVTSLDPATQITANNAFAIDKVFESLVSFNADGEVIPWLASDYNISDDGLTYTFTLRDGLKFSDGTDVTPDDVVFSLDRHLKLGDESPLPLSGPIDSIEATADNQVTITLTSAYTPLISELANFSNGIYPADFGGQSEEDFFKNPVGTGPFVVDEWDPNADISFTKNTNYWQDGKPYVDKLVYKLVSDDAQLQQQLQAGQLDIIDEVPYANVTELESNASVDVVTNKSWEIEQVFFNTQNEYFADEHVRRAVAQAIDRQGIVDAVTFGTATVANSLIPPTIEYSANDEGYALDYDLDSAKQELAQSAYPDGFSVTLSIKSGNSALAQEAQIVQQSLAEIGITVEIESLESATFSSKVYGDYNYDFMINSGQSDSPDPDGLVSFQADPDGFSHSYWTFYTNDDVTSLLNEGRETADGDARQQIYLDIQKIMAEQVPYIPLYYTSVIKATTSDISGLTVLPNGSMLLQDVSVTD